jgi:hypothetical protein
MSGAEFYDTKASSAEIAGSVFEQMIDNGNLP